MLSPNKLSKEYISNIVTNWLDWAKPFISTKVADILENVQSFSTLRHLNQLSTVREQINLYLYFLTLICKNAEIPTTLDSYIRTNFI